MQIPALVVADTIKLPAGVHLPDGTAVKIVVRDEGTGVLPPGYFERVAGALAGERFERPEDGGFEERTGW